MSMIIECKKLCLTRCLIAVMYSILIQYFLLSVFLWCINFHILHPLQWLYETLSSLFALRTWILSIPLIIAVAVNGVLLGKFHLAVQHYYASRFTRIVKTFFRKLASLITLILIGFLTSWLYSNFLYDEYSLLLYQDSGSDYLNSNYMFLLGSGISAGFYYFITENWNKEPNVIFPIIQEKKIVKIRSLLYSTLYVSLPKSFKPCLYYILSYWFFGNYFNHHIAIILNVEVNEVKSLLTIATNMTLMFYTWILTAQILSNMHLMQSFFSILLSEGMYFTIEAKSLIATNQKTVTLVEALSVTDIPIIQNLAALDLYNIANTSDMNRRQDIFALSVPGGHPYNWNVLSCQCLTLINSFTENLKCSIKSIPNFKSSPTCGSTIKPLPSEVAEKMLIRQYNESCGIRRMSHDLSSSTSTNNKEILTTAELINAQFENLYQQVLMTISAAFRAIPGFLYIFGEAENAKTSYLLANSQSIVWIIQGLVGICEVSIKEDKYGVVQSTLPEIIHTLIELKRELDKLTSVQLNGRKYDRSLINLRNALKRSLYKIAIVFGDYLQDLVQDPQDRHLMHCYTIFRDM